MTDFFELLSGDKCKRSNNKHVLMLNYIWAGGASRKELAGKLNISKVAVTRGVEQLIDLGFVVEEGQSISDSRGRRPVPLALKKDLFYSVGISLYDDGFSGIELLNARSDTVGKVIFEDLSMGWKAKCDYVIGKAKELIEEHGVSFDKVLGAGIALTGIVNPATGMVVSSSQFNEDKKFNLLEYFSMRFGKDCFLINTAHLKAYLEYKWGRAKNMSSFLCLHSGFGLGMFLNGRLYRGHQYHGGEVGAMQMALSGPQGYDGRVGTLGEEAPFYKITDRIEEVIARNGKTEVRKYLPEGENKVTLAMVVSAIEDGDQLCAQMMSELFETIGRAVVNLAYIFNPEAVFLAKWTARCPDVSLEIVRRMMGHYGVRNWELKTDILSAQCGNEDLAKGAALLPIENMFGNEL